jgi:signal transduction histidine kinase/DNA-binding response OmpR family regulator
LLAVAFPLFLQPVKRLLIFLCFGTSVFVKAYPLVPADSRADTTLVNILLKAASRQGDVNADSAQYYLEEALRLAEALEYNNGLLKVNMAMADLLIGQKLREKARTYLVKALAAARALQRKGDEGSILTDLGNQSYRIGEYVVAETYYQEALGVMKATGDAEGVVKLYTNLGMTYTKLTDYSRAFDALTRSNALADSLHLNEIIGGNHIDIAILLGLEKKFDESLGYYRKAVDVFKTVKDTIMVGYAELGIGETYMAMGDFERSITFFLSLKSTRGERSSEFKQYHNLGICYRAVNNLVQAELYFGKAQYVNDIFVKNPFYTLMNSLERAKLAQQQSQFERALVFGLRADSLARAQGALYNQRECLQVLASLYEDLGDKAMALQYMKQFVVVQDSIARMDQAKGLAEAETRFRLGEKNREVALLAKENELQKVRQRSDRQTMLLLGGSVMVLIVAAGYATRAYRRTQAKNNLLAEQKTAIEEANVLITAQSHRLQEADKIKSRFFANISHELRTPVTLLTGMLEFMTEAYTSPKQQERLNIALGNSRKLNNLIEQMLDLTRLEAGRVALKKRTVALHPLLARITAAFSSLLEKKQLRLITDNTAPQPVYLDVDEDKFEKIINNLIYNAVKFTPAGGWIRVQTKMAADASAVEIGVSDSGAGIAHEDLPHIFDRFYQSESGKQQHDVQGTGIGLSLVKEFTELHGGTVSVRSDAGEGAVFTLRFPLAAVHPEQTNGTDAEAPAFEWKKFEKKPRVLLVEDHEEMRAYVRELLGEGFDVSEAADGAAALQWLTLNVTDLIISDVMMPRMDGYGLLSQLKAHDTLRHVPVIMLTARSSEGDKLHGLSLGVDDYVVKPFNATELKIRVQNVLLNNAGRREWLLKPAAPGEDIVLPVKDDEGFMNAVVAYVEGRIEDPLIAVEDLASHLALSERQLYRKAGALTGLAPAQLIKEIRLKKAYQYLVEKKVTKVADLAGSVGYDSAAYFSRQFMERFGKRPTEFL